MLLIYQTFNSSCAWAALANLAGFHGVEATDRSLALDAGLPACIERGDDGRWVAGPFLQFARWFDLALARFDLRFEEIPFGDDPLADELERAEAPAMASFLREDGAHATVYLGKRDGRFEFLRIRHESEGGADVESADAEDVARRLRRECPLGYARRGATLRDPDVEIAARAEASIPVLGTYLEEWLALLGRSTDRDGLVAIRDLVCRALLLDRRSMLEISGDAEGRAELDGLLGSFVRATRAEGVFLPGDFVAEEGVRSALGRWKRHAEEVARRPALASEAGGR